jgi:hypothetical protein
MSLNISRIWSAQSRIERQQIAMRAENIMATPQLIPVLMTKVGGADGASNLIATWTYDIKSLDGTVIKAGLDIIKTTDPLVYYMPHRWRRPKLGMVIPATFGLIYTPGPNANGEPEWEQFGLVWCNEISDMEACE